MLRWAFCDVGRVANHIAVGHASRRSHRSHWPGRTIAACTASTAMRLRFKIDGVPIGELANRWKPLAQRVVTGTITNRWRPAKRRIVSATMSVCLHKPHLIAAQAWSQSPSPPQTCAQSPQITVTRSRWLICVALQPFPTGLADSRHLAGIVTGFAKTVDTVGLVDASGKQSMGVNDTMPVAKYVCVCADFCCHRYILHVCLNRLREVRISASFAAQSYTVLSPSFVFCFVHQLTAQRDLRSLVSKRESCSRKRVSTEPSRPLYTKVGHSFTPTSSLRSSSFARHGQARQGVATAPGCHLVCGPKSGRGCRPFATHRPSTALGECRRGLKQRHFVQQSAHDLFYRSSDFCCSLCYI